MIFECIQGALFDVTKTFGFDLERFLTIFPGLYSANQQGIEAFRQREIPERMMYDDVFLGLVNKSSSVLLSPTARADER